jgi:NCS1 family nucleobase:cation symporter-1
MESIRLLETWGAPFLLIVGAALFFWAWRHAGGLGPMLAHPPAPSGRPAVTTILGAGLTSAVAFWGTMALSIPDLSRFARGQKDQIVGQALGLPTTMALFAFIGAAVTNATGVIFGARISDPVTLLTRVGGVGTILLSMAGLIVATLAVNIAANIVAPANDFSNVRPSAVTFRTGATITALIGIVMMPWKLYSHAAAYIFTWLIGYGALLGPIAGIMITDYFVIRRGRLVVDDLYARGGAYEYSNGINWIAIAAFVLGVLPNFPGFIAAVSGHATTPLFAMLYNWAWFVGFLLAACVYLAGMKILPLPSVGEWGVGSGS